MRKKRISLALATLLFASAFSFVGCDGNAPEFVLRVGSWDEYIDEGGEESYAPDSRPLYEEFEDWYYQEYGIKVKVDYIPLQDNETMYSKIKLGDSYDLLCPSEYMMMKLVAENRLQPYPNEFFNKETEHNYYAKYVSPYIENVFLSGKTADGKTWRDYTAGYMWGTTGFVVNPNNVDPELAKSWSILQNPDFKRRITAKDNVRDAYFVGLGMHYEQQLLDLKARYALDNDKQTYMDDISNLMNDTEPETMTAVQKELEAMRKNLYGLETDEGKMDIIRGGFDISYQWSGDAVYVLDKAEEFDLELEYVIPESASNLWFDGWVMMKDIGDKKTQAAMAFVNFLSRPDNVVRNMYYIGYTSCISGNEENETVYEYIEEMYGDEEGETSYDLSYFFDYGATPHVITTTEDQLKRQLLAQYPNEETITRLVVMDYFSKEVHKKAVRMWTQIK